MNSTKLLLTSVLIGLMFTSSHAGQHLIDFAGNGANSSGGAAGWDVLDNLVQDTPYPLTDLSGGGDDDVILTAIDDGFNPNNPAPPGVDATYDGILVPKEARDDYLFKIDDTAGTSARIKIENLDAGQYNITVFEGRQTDPTQFAKIWVGDASGSGEPAVENTGNFAQGSATVGVDISAGDTLWYRHLEDNTGGISGMIINVVPEPSASVLLILGILPLLTYRRRMR